MNKIALVDCNSFFCSCERVFQPHLQNKPVIVLSSNDGCVVSRTDEAKQLGIPMGVPFFKIKDLCRKNHVNVFSSNFALYSDMSRRVMKVLSSCASKIQVYSVDEAFIDMRGLSEEKINILASEIKNKVFQWVGIPVSVGISTTKVLAKVANHMAKKNKIATQGVVTLFQPEKIDASLKKFPVEDLWGVGRKSAEKLFAAGIRTAYEFKNCQESRVRKVMGVQGARIIQELRGEYCFSLEPTEVEQKSISSSRSFGRPVKELTEVREAVANHITTVCEKLREQKGVARALTVYVSTNRFDLKSFYQNSGSYYFSASTAATNTMIDAAFSILDEIFKPNLEYKKVGVILSDITNASRMQLDLFSFDQNSRNEQVMQVIDHINRIQGKGSIKYAACGVDRFWRAKSDMKSRNYSTRWQDLLEVG